jgi:hypothetical protein
VKTNNVVISDMLLDRAVLFGRGGYDINAG